MSEKGGAKSEEQARKAYRAARGESDQEDANAVGNNVSSVLIEKVLISHQEMYLSPGLWTNFSQSGGMTNFSQLVRWMGMKAEELGVGIYPGFAASKHRKLGYFIGEGIRLQFIQGNISTPTPS